MLIFLLTYFHFVFIFALGKKAAGASDGAAEVGEAPEPPQGAAQLLAQPPQQRRDRERGQGAAAERALLLRPAGFCARRRAHRHLCGEGHGAGRGLFFFNFNKPNRFVSYL